MTNKWQNDERTGRQWHSEAPASMNTHPMAGIFFTAKLWQACLRVAAPDRKWKQPYTPEQYKEAERIGLELMDAGMNLHAAKAVVDKYGIKRI